MGSAELLTDAYGRIQGIVHRTLDRSSAEDLAFRAGPNANSIAWLVWHLSRVQDDHLSDAIGAPPVWSAAGWSERFALPFEIEATGFGHTSEDVEKLGAVPAELLLGYHDAVIERTVDFVSKLNDSDLERIIDTSYDPPVTLGVRLVSVISDNLQHAGQAAFILGIAHSL